MVEHPILFSAPMVRAILAGTKVQTRREMKRAHWPVATEPHDTPGVTIYLQSGEQLRTWYRFTPDVSALIEYRRPGGQLWGRDRWRRAPTPAQLRRAKQWHAARADQSPKKWSIDEVAGLCPYGVPGDRLWVRETWAEVPWLSGAEARSTVDPHVGARYRATWDKTHSAAWKPSIHMPRWASRLTLEVTGVRVERLHDISEDDARAEGTSPLGITFRDDVRGRARVVPSLGGPYRDGFRVLWEEINGAGSWDANPWLWVVGFARVEPKGGAR